MAGAFEGADACGDGGISICSAGGEHPSGKGGIVAAAVFCMQHQAQIQQLCLFIGKLPVRTDGVEDKLSGGMFLSDRMDVHALMIIMPAFDLIGIAHNGWKLGNELDGLPQNISMEISSGCSS